LHCREMPPCCVFLLLAANTPFPCSVPHIVNCCAKLRLLSSVTCTLHMPFVVMS
jgi:hypothetical protein